MGYNKKELKTRSTAKPGKSNPFKEDVITDPMGQWKHPGEVTRIPSGNITMKGVPYPVLGVDNLGNEQMMYPGLDYTFPGESVTEYPQMKKGGQRASLKRNKTHKNIKTSLNYIMAQNYDIFGLRGRRFYDPNAKFEDGGPFNLPDFFNAEYLMQNGGTSKFPTFHSRSEYERFKQGNTNFAHYSDSDMEGLGVNVPSILDMNKVKQNQYPYMPAGQTASGAGLFNNAQGQQFTFSNGAYNPYLPEVVAPVVSKKFGGDSSYPGQTQNSVLDEKKNNFMNYISKNTMKAIMTEETNEAHNFLKMCMGGYKKAQYGAETEEEGSPENDAFWNNTYQYNQSLANNSYTGNNPTFNDGLIQDGKRFEREASERRAPTDAMMHDKPFNSNPQQQLQQGSGKYTYTRSMEPEANWALAAMSKASSFFELRDAKERERKFKELQGADNQFRAFTGNDRGDYDQFGNFRPDDKVPVQFAGYNNGAQAGTPYTFQQGGEYYMTDDQINSIREAGGDIEFLD